MPLSWSLPVSSSNFQKFCSVYCILRHLWREYFHWTTQIWSPSLVQGLATMQYNSSGCWGHVFQHQLYPIQDTLCLVSHPFVVLFHFLHVFLVTVFICKNYCSLIDGIQLHPATQHMHASTIVLLAAVSSSSKKQGLFHIISCCTICSCCHFIK